MKLIIAKTFALVLVCGQLASGCHLRGVDASSVRSRAAQRRHCDATTQWVDRMEGQWAVLVGEGGVEDVVSRRALPVDVREGDVLRGGRRDTVCSALLREDVLSLLGAP